MTPDIEQIRAELKHARLTKDRIDGAEACMSWAEEYGSALLAAIDELTAENSTLSKDLDVAVRLLGASGKHLRTCASEEDTGNYVPCDCGLDRLVKW